MKKSLFNLSVAALAFTLGIFTAGIFRTAPEPLPKPLFEKEIVDIPLYEAAPPDEPEDVDSVEYVESKVIYAWYSLDSYKGMPEVAMIYFYGADVDDNGNQLDKMAFDAGIYTNMFKDDVDEGFAQGIQTTVEGNKLKFKTKKLKGIEYSFEGTFYKDKMTGEQNEKLLRGTLRKFVRGKKVAEVTGDFAFEEPYCLH